MGYLNSIKRIGRHGRYLTALAVGVGIANFSHAAAIDVQLSRNTITPTAYPVVGSAALVPAGNSGGFAASPLTIPAAPGVNYDAADTTDSGTQWNSLSIPQVTVSATTVEEQNVPLVDSNGNATSVQLAMSFVDPSLKTDEIHNEGVTTGTNPGIDGLSSNPTGLMNQSWQTNSTSESISFSLTGLPANTPYNLFVYGAGVKAESGGSYTLSTANQGSDYNSASGAYSTEPVVAGDPTNGIYRSVFDNTGINPIPELGLSWTELPAVSDSTGTITFTAGEDIATAIKGSINGFQLDQVPEPASIGMLAFGGMALLGRRNRK
jgi:PEP-CTERM motif